MWQMHTHTDRTHAALWTATRVVYFVSIKQGCYTIIKTGIVLEILKPRKLSQTQVMSQKQNNSRRTHSHNIHGTFCGLLIAETLGLFIILTLHLISAKSKVLNKEQERFSSMKRMSVALGAKFWWKNVFKVSLLCE